MSRKPIVIYVRMALLQLGHEWRERNPRRYIQRKREAMS